MLHGYMRLRLLGFLWIPHEPSTQTAREPGIVTWHRRDISTKISFRPSEGLSLIISHCSYTVTSQTCSYFHSFRNQMVPFFFKGFSIIVVHCSSKGTTRGDMATAWVCRQCRQCQVSKGSCKSSTWRCYRCGKWRKMSNQKVGTHENPVNFFWAFGPWVFTTKFLCKIDVDSLIFFFWPMVVDGQTANHSIEWLCRYPWHTV